MTNRNFFNFPQVHLVEASAGSGKTYQLTKRYVQLLFVTCKSDVTNIKQVLAITFTNKAAQEMKSRILDFLKKAALGQLQVYEIDDVLKPIGVSEAQAVALSAQLLDFILREYHYFAVQTIDSFINALLAGSSFKIGLSARFNIARNSHEYLQLALDELILKSVQRAPLKQLFDDYLKQYLFLENRAGWFPKDDLLMVLKTLYRQVNTHGVPLLGSDHRMDTIVNDKQRFYQLLKAIHDRKIDGLQKRFKESLANFVEQAVNGFDIDSLSDYWQRDEMPLLKGISVDDDVIDLWDKAKALLNDICLQEAFGIFNPYISLHHELNGVMTQHQIKDDVLFLEQLNHQAKRLFSDDLVSVAELYYRLATRFRHYLIDEFQDTNPVQWQNIKPMVEESLSSDGSLFIVGDIKQAIYGFRGGDSKLLGLLANNYIDLLNRDTLSINRRSRQVIVDFNNRIFAPDNLTQFLLALQERSDNGLSQHDQDEIKDVFKKADQEFLPNRQGGLVDVTVIAGATQIDRDVLTQVRLVEIITQLISQYQKSDVAVLVRSNHEVEKVTGWLMGVGVAVHSERTSDIKTHPVIADILLLLRCCYFVDDHVAFTQFLLSDLATKTFAINHDLLSELCFKSRGGLVEEAFKGQYPEIYEQYILPLRLSIGQYPLYEWMISVYRLYAIQSHYPDAQAFLMHLLEIVKRKENETIDAAAFLDIFDNLEDELRFINLPHHDAIRVLTVHKAKGLEFPIVVLPFLEMPVKVGASHKDGAMSFSVLLDGDHASLVRLKKKYTQFSPALERLWRHEYKKNLLNELCTVYVALTRAVDQMYVFIPEKAGNSINPAMLLVPPEHSKVSVPEQLVSQHHLPVEGFLPPLALGNWLDFLKEEHVNDDERLQRLTGERWHQVLALIQFIHEDNVEEAVRSAVSVIAKQWGLSRAQVQEDEIVVTAFIKRPDVWPHFKYRSDTEVYSERSIVNAWGDLRRIDRFMITDKEVLLIDFKMNRLSEVYHHQQINEYIDMIKDLYPTKQVNGVLLYINDGNTA